MKIAAKFSSGGFNPKREVFLYINKCSNLAQTNKRRSYRTLMLISPFLAPVAQSVF
jgi:hypothetical protein